MVDILAPTEHTMQILGSSLLPETWEAAVLPIDKPKGFSSFDVIRVLRRIIGVRKIGHAGTLDPMATGLLICLVGKATKQMEAFMGLPKCYSGRLRLGEVTPSYDAETEVSAHVDPSAVTDADLEAARVAFVGNIEQRPPVYSAIKIGGERLYRKARRGERPEIPTRAVTVTRFAITSHQGPDVEFEIDCSKGTYIRSIAHDLGAALGVGAHLTALRRTAIGPHRVDDAWTLDALRARMEVA